MDFTIRKVVLYPEKSKFPLRVIEFVPGRINIITGTSQRGKSAVSKIIDYCLGASKCAIPVGIIRESVSWFAIEVFFNGKYIFIARKSPKNLNTSGECYVEEKTEPITLPHSIEKNHSLKSLKSFINGHLGLPNITLDPHATEAYNAQPSYRDIIAFNYLPQHIVANPYTLFFRTEKAEYRERLTRMFPLALGIVDNKYYLLLSEQESLQKKVADLTKEIDSIKATAEKIKTSIVPYINEAIELGLIEKRFSFNDNVSKAVDRLRKTVVEGKDLTITNYLDSQTSEAVEELVRIIGEEDRIAKEIEKSRRQLTRYRQLSGYMELYSEELTNQTARVGILDWFRENISENPVCILCGRHSDYSSQEVKWLRKVADSIKSESQKISQEPVRLEKDVDSLRRHIDDLHTKLMEKRKERVELEVRSKDAEKARFSFQQVNQFIGRMQQAIVHIDYSEDSSDIQMELDSFKKQLSSIRSKINKYQTKKNLEESLFLISHNTKKHAAHLELERSNSKINFDTKELMLGFFDDSPDEKEKLDYLFEIGSGENWMGYHIAFFLALHQKFIDVCKSPVKSPVFSFLIIDQPTQVYFPSIEAFSTYDQKKSIASKQVAQTTTNDIPKTDSLTENSKEHVTIEMPNNNESVLDEKATSFDVDVAKARRIFEVLSHSLKSTKEQYQIIVTEHADEDVWGDVELVHKVADWRGESSDSYLVPLEWIETPVVNNDVPPQPTKTPKEDESGTVSPSLEYPPIQKPRKSNQKMLFDIEENTENDELS